MNQIGNLELILSGSYGLNGYKVVAGRIEKQTEIRDCWRKSVTVAPRRETAHEYVWIECRFGHSDPVAERRSARFRARRIDGDDGYPLPAA